MLGNKESDSVLGSSRPLQRHARLSGRLCLDQAVHKKEEFVDVSPGFNTQRRSSGLEPIPCQDDSWKLGKSDARMK